MNLKFAFVIMFTAAACSASGDRTDPFDNLLGTGRFDEAKAVVEKTPAGPEQNYLRAKTFFYEGDYESAAREMGLAAVSPKNGQERGLFAEYYAQLYRNIREHETFRSEHFVLKAKGADTALAGYALDVLEKVYGSDGAALGCYPKDAALVEVYPDKSSFSLASTIAPDVLEKSGTIGICKFNRIMILSPRALPLGYSWADTLCHEYVHYLLNRISRGLCPLWLQEGTAKYYETCWRASPPLFLTPAAKNCLAKAAKENNYITFKRMHPSLVFLKDQDEILLAFSEVTSAVDYMRSKYGPGIIPRLAAEMQAGGEKRSFKKVLGISEDRFESEFSRDLKAGKYEESPGAAPEKINFIKPAEEEFIGADQRGQIRLGDLMRRMGRPKAAVDQYEKALSAEPANPVILLKIAKALMESGDAAGAEARLKTAAEKNPGYVTVFETLGELCFSVKDYDGAIENLLKANLINPFDPALHYCLSRSYIEKNDKERAVSEMKVLLTLRPDDAETKLLLESLNR